MIKKKYFILYVICILILNIFIGGLIFLWNNKKYDVQSQPAGELSRKLMAEKYTPENGFVPNEKTAIQFAQAAASVRFPGQQVPFYDSYDVYWDQENEHWIVYIYDIGGMATYVVIDKKSGEIINILGVR